MKIQDGTGSGFEVKVTEENRIETASIVQDAKDHATDLEDKYNLATGDIAITNATKITAFYLESQEDFDIVVTSLIYNLGASTGGAGDWLVDIIRNPLIGDIITNANNIEANSNQNFSSNKVLASKAYVGAQGETIVSGGESSILSRIPSGRVVIDLGALVIPKGKSLAVNITPQAGNTSVNMQVAASVYVKKFDI